MNKELSFQNARDNEFITQLIQPITNGIEGFQSSNFWESMQFGRDPTANVFYSDAEFHLLEANFRNFCVKQLANPQIYDSPPSRFSIPAKLHFIWLGSVMPPDVELIINTWKLHHPGWEVHIWNDAKLPDFTWTSAHTKKAFYEAKTWAEKADVLRYETLYQFGGVYSDIDIICYKSFNDLISQEASFIAGQETNHIYPGTHHPLYICTALIAAAAGDAVIDYCLKHLTTLEDRPGISQLIRTGPLLLSDACRHHLTTTHRERILVLPCSYFYPLPYFHNQTHKQLTANEIRRHFISQESMAVHLWAKTW